ncbi:MAG: prolyl-tRNA synthetase associated domain-containing protein [Anaerolineales bacterium]|nr:prolyl-tRNA synthetase associated domain-containing protein [Anaerolineales bacterium]
MLAATPLELFARLAELGISVANCEHPPVFTVEESRALRGNLPGGHCKNLFLKDKKGHLWLLVVLEELSVNLKVVRSLIDSKQLSFAKTELLTEVLGVDAGAVTPFALINDKVGRVNVVLQREMLKHKFLNYHPLVNTATTTIGSDDLLKFIRACGHTPKIISLASEQ